MTTHRTPIRVRYAETDQMGIVYHSNYYIWMEVGRVEFCRAAGFNYKDMEADGILLAVAETHCRHLSPARYDDEIVIETSIREKNARMMTFAYEITCGDRTLATGWTKHIFLGRDMRPVRLPQAYAGVLGNMSR